MGDFKLFKKTKKISVDDIISKKVTMEEVNKVISDSDLNGLRNLIPKDVRQAYQIPSYFRRSYIAFMGFSFINYAYIDALSNFLAGKKVLEVMSGSGLLSMLLKEKGIDIIATDISPGYENDYHFAVFNPDIEKLDAIAAVEKYGKDVDYVIMSWPPYNDPIAAEVMKKIKEVNNNINVIYIGEGPDGCTADQTFFDIVDGVYSESFEKVQHTYSNWSMIHDLPFIIRNK
jgi:predicted nicotinamide N-methyase